MLQRKIGCAEPLVWNIICKHDAAHWYHASAHAGKYLVVSSFALAAHYAEFPATTIEQTFFAPAALPPKEGRALLAHDPLYLAQQPAGWGEAIVQGLAKMAGAPAEIFSDLLQTWTAVHANFVTPWYRSGAEGKNAPHSIADSAQHSSCCVELFNLLDS